MQKVRTGGLVKSILCQGYMWRRLQHGSAAGLPAARLAAAASRPPPLFSTVCVGASGSYQTLHRAACRRRDHRDLIGIWGWRLLRSCGGHRRPSDMDEAAGVAAIIITRRGTRPVSRAGGASERRAARQARVLPRNQKRLVGCSHVDAADKATASAWLALVLCMDAAAVLHASWCRIFFGA